jgi:xanthosine utilization system XapX-like protein
MDILGEVIEIPIWFLAAIGLAGALVGVILVTWAITVLGGKGKKAVSDPRDQALAAILSELQRPGRTSAAPAASTAEPVLLRRVPMVMASGTPAKPAAAPKPTQAATGAPKPQQAQPSKLAPKVKMYDNPLTMVQVTESGLMDLERCTATKMNYRIGAAASLLGLDVAQVNKLLSSGELKSVVVDSTRWILAESMTDMLTRIGISTSPEADEDSGASEGDIEEASSLATFRVSGNGSHGSTSLPYKQRYWYFVDGSDKGFVSLRDALRSVGYPVKDTDKLDWRKLPADVRNRIQREEVKEAKDAGPEAQPSGG